MTSCNHNVITPQEIALNLICSHTDTIYVLDKITVICKNKSKKMINKKKNSLVKQLNMCGKVIKISN